MEFDLLIPDHCLSFHFKLILTQYINLIPFHVTSFSFRYKCKYKFGFIFSLFIRSKKNSVE